MIGALFAAFVATASHGCPQFFAGGAPPVVPAAIEICFDGYSLGHSATLRDPLWSAEHISPGSAQAALGAKRSGSFHKEPLLPASDQAKTSDYRCSIYDRGHMTPVGDFGSHAEENDTFTMANMVPQDFRLNEGLWAGIENALLKSAGAGAEFYIVTGPAFGASAAMLNGRVAIPSTTWKAVYDPVARAAAAYVTPNDASGHYLVMSITDLGALIGFDPMPALPPEVKAVAGQLPAPTKGTTAQPDRTCAPH
jgi:endonuclease G